ncbi:MAG TPA: glycosyltransferase [Rhodothermales bacterium]|nr:glycosyltransferase [Rhodothermales bacterium]
MIPSTIRPSAEGKFIYAGDEKVYLRGITYGPFQPGPDGSEYHTVEVVEAEFAQMRSHGINTVRTYTVPPRWFLDAAHDHGLYVLIGLPWEQHITFLDAPQTTQSILAGVREGVRSCAGHPAVLGYAVGNEIPASIVRWYGPRHIARFIKRLYLVAKEEDPAALVTYVNFPTTEYLQHYLSFLDFVCFNVYLEAQDSFDAYVARLQNLTGDRPLVMAEIGLDSHRNGLHVQAQTLDWQIRTTFAAGGAGVFVFSWTDEWFRGGAPIEDWDFGLTDRHRCPKPALQAVANAFADVPFPRNLSWPQFSVVICSYNGASTIHECLDAVQRLDYPNFEVIVVDDGSTDDTASIARAFDVRLIQSANQGLSAARNTGMDAAKGEIIAYLDDDAYPDSHWLTYLASTFMTTEHAAVGGPNLAPSNDGLVADAVNYAPGNPIHVLFSDRVAEHIPGCNMAIRIDALQSIGGFDSQFNIAGDDVDVCWRLQQQGWTLGYHPVALVWHHRRRTIRTFWQQQLNYGKAEALLEMKWPEKYNQLGHLRWRGRVYNGDLAFFSAFRRWRIYYGKWGTSLFQSLHAPRLSVSESLPLIPEWYFLIAAMAIISAIGLFWPPLLWVSLLLAIAVVSLLIQAGRSAARIWLTHTSGHSLKRLRYLIAFLHLMQPLARLIGRLRLGLTPWRQLGTSPFFFPGPHRARLWSENWQAPEAWLTSLELTLYAKRTILRTGNEFDRWDLEVRGGLFGATRLLMATEEHGAGKQLLRFHTWPRLAPLTQVIALSFGALAFSAALHHAWVATALLSLIASLCLLRGLRDCAASQMTTHQAIAELKNTNLSADAQKQAVSAVPQPPNDLAPVPKRRLPFSAQRAKLK